MLVQNYKKKKNLKTKKTIYFNATSALEKDQRKNLRSNSDKIVSLPTRIKKEYNRVYIE